MNGPKMTMNGLKRQKSQGQNKSNSKLQAVDSTLVERHATIGRNGMDCLKQTMGTESLAHIALTT